MRVQCWRGRITYIFLALVKPTMPVVISFYHVSEIGSIPRNFSAQGTTISQHHTIPAALGSSYDNNLATFPYDTGYFPGSQGEESRLFPRRSWMIRRSMSVISLTRPMRESVTSRTIPATFRLKARQHFHYHIQSSFTFPTNTQYQYNTINIDSHPPRPEVS